MVHGLLRRVHAHPLAYDLTEEEARLRQYARRQGAAPGTTPGTTPGSSTAPFDRQDSLLSLATAGDHSDAPPAAHDGGAPAEGVVDALPPALRERRGDDHDGASSGAGADFFPAADVPDGGGRGHGDGALAGEMAAAMDGTRCDDELACAYGMAAEEMVAYVRADGRWDVAVLYAVRPEMKPQ